MRSKSNQLVQMISIFLLAFVFSCEKKVPNVIITTDKESYNPGETIFGNVSAVFDHKLTYMWVTIETRCNIQGGNFFPQEYKGAGTLIEIKKNSRSMSGEFTYKVPFYINESPCGWLDQVKIIVICESYSRRYYFSKTLSIM